MSTSDLRGIARLRPVLTRFDLQARTSTTRPRTPTADELEIGIGAAAAP